MEYRKLGNSEIELSVIGVGTWAIGGSGWKYGWGKQSDKESIETLLYAFEHGINWVDTAPIYGIGHAETIVGKALCEYGRDIIVATKCGLHQDKKGDLFGRLTAQSIRQELEQSLKRLAIDVIDIYQIHWPNPSREIEEGFETLLRLKEEGKVKEIAVSNFSRAQMEKIYKLGNFVSLQSEYNLLDRDVEIDILPWCREHSVGFLAYSPLKGGLLTGKVSKDWIERLPVDDWRKTSAKAFKEPFLSESLAKLKRFSLKDINICNNSVTWSQVAIKWVLTQPGVTSAIVGVRNIEQIREILELSSWELSSKSIQELNLHF